MAQTSLEPSEDTRLRFANWVLALCIVFFGVWLIYALVSGKLHVYQKLTPASAAIVCLLVLRARTAIRITCALMIVGMLGGIYSAELALSLIDPEAAKQNRIRRDARQHGIPFDPRSRIQVISDLRKQHVLAYPPLYPWLLLNSPLWVDGITTIPLASVPNAVTVSCNEGGQYLIFTTDEHGFANPSGLWNRGRADVAIIGDSVAVGECVPASENLASQLRQRYPHTISFGEGGNGPLAELATLKEYLPYLKPTNVVWLFYEGNDMDDLEVEKRSPILMRYLDHQFRQGLVEREEHVSNAVASFFEQSLIREQAPKKKNLREKLISFLLLKNVRLFFWGFMDTTFALDRTTGDFGMFERVLREAQQTVDGWRGRLTVVYLPAPFRYPGQYSFSRRKRDHLDQMHSGVLDVARKLQIPIIDLTSAFPDLSGSASGQNGKFFYPYFAHYRPEGYRVIGHALVNALSSVAGGPVVNQ